MIATVPRSGSTAFCLELWRTGLLGAPLEYTNLELMNQDPRWRKLLRRELQFWRELQRLRTGTNGVFAYKFFVQGYIEILSRKPKLLPCISPTHVVYFTRNDKLAQAISYSRAIRSGAWFANVSAPKPCAYDEAHLQECLDLLSRQEESWEHVFDITKMSPLRVTYEDFMSAPDAVVQTVLGYVVPGSRARQSLWIPQIEIQRDAVSEDWRRRFFAHVVHDPRSADG
ncbi:MAG: Stf0 family sulfotransferase [Pseudomonadota bacterium]|jgi:LPS sulfotransferase NodH|nr:Stf0 family sulfotransferase [Pseudomonadota bacterium]